MTKERISLILELSAMFLSFHIMVLSFFSAPILGVTYLSVAAPF